MNQRNALLKYFALNHVLKMTLAIYNEQLDGFARYIFEKEKSLLNN
jgi:DNA replication and repair protein RecF